MTADSNITVRDSRADDVSALNDIFRSSVRVVARRDYTQAQVIAWAPDMIDSSAWKARYTKGEPLLPKSTVLRSDLLTWSRMAT